jgi:hypothetical protein
MCVVVIVIMRGVLLLLLPCVVAQYEYVGCYAHRSGENLIKTWDTTGLTLTSCHKLASSRGKRFFVLEFPQGYSATFKEPVASCGYDGGDFTHQINDAYCLFRGLYMGGPGAMAVYQIMSPSENQDQQEESSPVVVAYWPEDRPNQFEMDDSMCSFGGRCVRTCNGFTHTHTHTYIYLLIH